MISAIEELDLVGHTIRRIVAMQSPTKQSIPPLYDELRKLFSIANWYPLRSFKHKVLEDWKTKKEVKRSASSSLLVVLHNTIPRMAFHSGKSRWFQLPPSTI